MFLKSKKLIVLTIIICLIFVWLAVPFLNNFFRTNNEPFSELWLLDPEGKTENFPYNITSNQNYDLYLGVSNQLNEDTKYSLRVKLCNSANQLPNSNTGEPSSSSVIENFEFLLSDENDWETKLTFALEYQQIQQNITQIETIKINGNPSMVNSNSIWDSNRNGFYSILLFELWTYDVASNSFSYSNQCVHLQLNINSTSNFDV